MIAKFLEISKDFFDLMYSQFIENDTINGENFE